MEYQSVHTGKNLDDAIEFMLTHDQEVAQALLDIKAEGDAQVQRLRDEMEDLILSNDGVEEFEDF